MESGTTVDAIERSLAWSRLAPALFADAGANADIETDAAPPRLGGYTLLGVLGRGATGTVYRACDNALGREVAIKVLSDEAGGGDPAGRERILGEARALARLSHPAIVTVHGVGELDDRIYLVMVRAQGATLRAWQAQPGRRWRELLAAYLEVARGLEVAHERGVIHRDLKPDNVVVGDDGRVKILDFGMASVGAGEIAGTPAYMAPEHARGAPPAPSMDLYSLAASLHEALHGLRPGEAATGAPVAPASPAPAAIDAVLERALAATPSRRWPSMRALIGALERASAATPDDRARVLLLERVESAWIDGVLARTGDGASPLRLAGECGRARYDLVEETAYSRRQADPTATKLVSEAAASVDGSLLIVGEAGAGKTTALLGLARDALRRARLDPEAPAPVVLGLASWSLSGATTLAGWVLDELRDTLGIPRRIAAQWLAGDRLMLLLDGLDEVAPGRRAACVRAIRAHRAEHLAPLLVTCRRGVAEELACAGLRLQLAAAIELAPLDPERVALLLERAGPDLAGLRAAVAGDPALGELLARSPLLLDTAARAFRGRPAAALRELHAGGALRTRIWAAYLGRSLEPRPPGRRSPAELLAVLAWLAAELGRRGQGELWIERLQPSCLAGQGERIAHAGLTLALFGGGAAAIIAATLAWATTPSIVGATAALSATALALFVGLILGVREIEPFERLSWSTAAMVAGLRAALACGVTLGLAIAAIAALVWGLGEPVAVVVALFVANFVAYALLFSVTLVVVGGLVGVAPLGRIRPGQGIWTAARNTAVVGGAVALVLAAPMLALTVMVGAPPPPPDLIADGAAGAASPAFIEAAALWRDDPLSFALALELCVALTLGYVAGALRGGFAALQHITLRLILALRGRLPLDLVGLLGEASERGLLHRIGGGYRFVHAELQEYLAGDAPASSRST